jgi:ribosome-associated heat shock protein Hsp15
LAGPGAKPDTSLPPRLRLDKWLFQARFFRSREVASEVVGEGHLRLNGQHCLKPGHLVGVGDVLTFVQGHRIRVVRVLAISQRRGPAEEAQRLYLDLEAEKPMSTGEDAPRTLE